MSHLSPETLARLVEEAPQPAEHVHLETCDACREELDALREQTRALGGLPDPDPAAGDWARLRRRLATEGLIESGGGRFAAPAWRLAAAIALMVVGGVAGAALQGATAGRPAGVAVVGPADPSLFGAPALATTADQAASQVRAAEAAYLGAVARYLELAEPEELPDPVARLAALEGIVLTTRAALSQAPADPVINGFHMAATAQREAMLTRLAVAERPWF